MTVMKASFQAAVVALLAASAVALLAKSPAWANDSTAELTTGGLVFVRNDDIQMRSEDLFISVEEIRVRYRFFNTSAKDVTVHVAFPMPTIEGDKLDYDLALPSNDPENLLDFVTHVAGKPVETQVEQKALAKGADRTAYLRALGIPLAPHLQEAREAVNRLPREKWDELIGMGLAKIEEFDAGKGMQKALAPTWSLQTTFYWQQTFPARKELLIEHRYKPSVGMSVMTALGLPELAGEPWFPPFRDKYCIEKDILDAVDRARRTSREGNVPFSEERIDYVLKTGANWAGPIGQFRLVVDKGERNALVSFCGTGVKKIGPTRFEMRKTNFTPEGNISILILKRLPPQ
jgi:hypothetical protein